MERSVGKHTTESSQPCRKGRNRAKMVKGGIVLLDDYGFTDFAPQKKAFDRFASEHDIRILSLPTGQGMFLKP